MYYMINNSVADCAILLMFDTEFDNVRPDQQQTFDGSVTAYSVTTNSQVWGAFWGRPV